MAAQGQNGVAKAHSILDGSADTKCEDPRCLQTSKAIHYCIDCASSYCDDCWVLQTPHLPSKRGRDNLPHEKTNPQTFRCFSAILHPPAASVGDLRKAHEEDAASKWFGVTKDVSGQLKFNDYGRYASLMATLSSASPHLQRYPSIVSFQGQTNAGKSTCVKMLIARALAKRKELSSTPWPSPVVGSVLHDSTPTTGDVNLYADPKTLTSTMPILFADCEGFEGGESLPLGAIARRDNDGEEPDGAAAPSVTAASHPIQWSNTDDTRQREYAVMNLYPRICYTFSDVVVFVLRNPKTFQSSVLTKLLDWGVNSLEKSINQPALPHAIVVLNATDPNVDEREWSVPFATQNLLSSIQGCIDGPDSVPRIQKLAEYWRQMNKSIVTIEDLLLQYYSSFQIVRIPSSRYMLLDTQVQKLQTMIEIGCAKSFSAKRKARMLTNGDELNTYFQAGFRHFATHLNIPFDFVEVSLRNNPIPSDFGGHILHLATRIAGGYNGDAERLMWFFEHLSSVLASCIVLDIARFRKGRISELFRNYERSVDWMLNEFFDMYWPCSYSQIGRRCQLVKARHIKGHQDTAGVISFGEYDAGISITNAVATFKSELLAAMDRIQRDHDYENDDTGATEKVADHKLALNLHKDYLKQFFSSIGIGPRLFSHSSCFVCLMNVPAHPLPCGHVICSSCVKAYGSSKGRSTIVINACPLHDDLPPWSRWLRPVQIQFKPKGMGTRILALDGAGVRGIVQLETLREIEESLGNLIPISCFFDLIVGSGTGAIAAAALGIQQRRLASETIDMYIAMMDVAYAPRLAMIPLNKIAPFMPARAKFKTKPMRQAIEMAFGRERKIFGGVESAHDEIKVGMTAVTGAERSGILLGNYHRPDDHASSYILERPWDASFEMDLWEAIAASTATAGSFKPFVHEKTHRSYLDASSMNPNPSAVAERERKLIWPDTQDLDPDLFLNLGCGQNRARTSLKVQENRTGKRMSGQASVRPNLLQQLWASRGADDVLQSELAWLDFEDSLPVAHDPNGKHYLRFNPDLESDPPRGDDKSALRSLRELVIEKLKLPHRQKALQYLGHRLVATSFYFELKNKTLQADNSYLCTGSIVARFEDGSEYINMLGRFLNSKFSPRFGPHFAISSDTDEPQTQPTYVPIERVHLEQMIYSSSFEIKDVNIRVRDETKPTMITLTLAEQELLGPTGLPISGFPRWLLLDKPPRPAAEVDHSARASTQSSFSMSASTARASSHTTNTSIGSPPRKSSNLSFVRRSDESMSTGAVPPLPPANSMVTNKAEDLGDIKEPPAVFNLKKAPSKASSVHSDGSQAIDWAYVASLKAAKDKNDMAQQLLQQQRQQEQQRLLEQQREHQRQTEEMQRVQSDEQTQEQLEQRVQEPPKLGQDLRTSGNGPMFPEVLAKLQSKSPSPDLTQQREGGDRTSYMAGPVEQRVAVALPVSSGKQVQIRPRGKSGGRDLLTPQQQQQLAAQRAAAHGRQPSVQDKASDVTATTAEPSDTGSAVAPEVLPRNLLPAFPEHRASVGRDDSPILPLTDRHMSLGRAGGPSALSSQAGRRATTGVDDLKTRHESSRDEEEEVEANADDNDYDDDDDGEHEHHFPMEPFFPGKKDDVKKPKAEPSPLSRTASLRHGENPRGKNGRGRARKGSGLVSELPANEEPSRAGAGRLGSMERKE